MSRDDHHESRDADREDARAFDQKIASYLEVGVPLCTLSCAVAAGLVGGAPAVVLVLAGGALLTVIAVFWTSVRTLVGEVPLSGADAYALGAPRAEEEKKRAVLRALKDLEFERSVGKISDEDYAELVAGYRAEAKRLLRALDDEARPGTALAEEMLEERLVAEGLVEPKATTEPNAKAEPRARACAACGTHNDEDARFCKRCGEKVGADDQETAS